METRSWYNTKTKTTVQVPRGIDPGFQENVGLHSPGRDASNRLIQKIDAAPEDLPVISRPWNTPEFRAHLDGKADPATSWPIAVVDARVRAAIGGRSRTVRLSKETADKQAGRLPTNIGHPDIVPTDYSRVQRILDRGEIWRQSEHTAISLLTEDDGQVWMVAIKSTRDSRETYLSSLHRIHPRDIKRLAGKYSPIVR